MRKNDQDMTNLLRTDSYEFRKRFRVLIDSPTKNFVVVISPFVHLRSKWKVQPESSGKVGFTGTLYEELRVLNKTFVSGQARGRPISFSQRLSPKPPNLGMHSQNIRISRLKVQFFLLLDCRNFHRLQHFLRPNARLETNPQKLAGYWQALNDLSKKRGLKRSELFCRTRVFSPCALFLLPF